MASSILRIDKTFVINERLDKFTKPFNNQVYMTNLNNIMLKLKPVYYGDEIDMFFWRRMNVVLGETKPSTIQFHRQDGYKYRYYRDKNKFIIHDENNLEVINKKVDTLADLGIDFDIYKSHQFMIYVNGSGLGLNYFLRSVKIQTVYNNFNKLGLIGLVGIGGEYQSKQTSESDLYTILGEYPDWFFVKETITMNSHQMGRFNGINYYDIKNEATGKYPFYFDVPKPKAVNIELKDIPAKKLDINDVFIIPLLALSMFPHLLPVEKEGETLNNRVLYEPFLIWGFYKILVNKYNFDELKLYLDVFDLSPNWE